MRRTTHWFLAPTALFLAGATPALALDAGSTVDIPAPPAKVWQTIGDFCGIAAWHPAIETCTPGERGGMKTRQLALRGGGAITEEQVSRDDKVMRYSYTILDGPLPVTNYRSTLAVMPEGSGSRVTWSGTFDAKGAPDADATRVIQGVYDSGLKGLAEKAR